ncbi:hypothetical protein B0T36_06070 [Nocardia donostiensis]|nr:hypothetical protein B0T36_06070 [Nocardia donostiensis]
MWGLPIVVLGGLQLVVMLDGTVVALAAGRHLRPQTGIRGQVAVFTLTSLLCGLAWDQTSLIVGRAL